MKKNNQDLQTTLDETFSSFERALESYKPELKMQEFGQVWSVERGIARIHGLPRVKSEEVVRFEGGKLGIAFNLDTDEVSVVLLAKSDEIEPKSEVYRTEKVVDVPVGEGLLGRIIDPSGRPLDEKGTVDFEERRPIERDAPDILDRAPVSVPLQTGIKVVDSLIPIGRGQRELILGDRQIGKTAITLDTIINQRDTDVFCIYCAIGKERSDVGKFIADLREYEAMEYTVVVVATGEDAPGLNFAAPYAATTIGEYFMLNGEDALVVYDDLTRHARAYREISLLLRRPPAREAYPGDIFYIHSRMLERSTHLSDELGGGSLTALPIIETQEQNISAYIPTNLISITDGQIYLSPKLFQEGVMPAIDVGESVSRVGGKTQLPAYRDIASSLRTSYSQFEELEAFARFGAELEEETRQTLLRGRRIRETFKQTQYEPIPPEEQIAVLMAVNEGIFDELSPDEVEQAKNSVREAFREKLTKIGEKIKSGKELEDEDKEKIVEVAKEAIESEVSSNQDETTDA